ncbi:MAG: rhomboid family intramembrane serine protease [Methylacidiphilales bacterium]|nr:rhomboid family intramembrane serine protease [Candidatus Methylacidiphilales bacterium]
MVQNLIILNGVFFLLQSAVPEVNLDPLALQMVCYPSHCFITFSMLWQLFTYSLLHGGIFHFAFNMYSLWLFGNHCETYYGSAFFIVTYLVSVVIAGMLHIAIAIFLNQSTIVIGASGGVFGVLLLFGFTFPRLELQLLFPPIKLSAKTLVIVYGVLELLFGVGNIFSSVAHFAHLGGLLGGYLCYRFRTTLLQLLFTLKKR